MPARVCKRCDRAYPYLGYSKCVVCEGPIDYVASATPMDGHEILGLQSTLKGAAAEMDRAEREARRRGALWSVADVLLEIPMRVWAEPDPED